MQTSSSASQASSANGVEGRSARERAEREEMFSFHPDILSEGAPLPRRSDGAQYDLPTSTEQTQQ